MAHVIRMTICVKQGSWLLSWLFKDMIRHVKSTAVSHSSAIFAEWIIKERNKRNELLYMTSSCGVYPSGTKGRVLTYYKTVNENTKEMRSRINSDNFIVF